jgi:hypothetical protein
MGEGEPVVLRYLQVPDGTCVPAAAAPAPPPASLHAKRFTGPALWRCPETLRSCLPRMRLLELNRILDDLIYHGQLRSPGRIISWSVQEQSD